MAPVTDYEAEIQAGNLVHDLRFEMDRFVRLYPQLDAGQRTRLFEAFETSRGLIECVLREVEPEAPLFPE